MAPVRARIASSNVVLPLWNGPTNAMHRGPAEFAPVALGMHVSFDPPGRPRSGKRGYPGTTIVSKEGGRWQGRRHTRVLESVKERWPDRPCAHENGRLCGRPLPTLPSITWVSGGGG